MLHRCRDGGSSLRVSCLPGFGGIGPSGTIVGASSAKFGAEIMPLRPHVASLFIARAELFV